MIPQNLLAMARAASGTCPVFTYLSRNLQITEGRHSIFRKITADLDLRELRTGGFRCGPQIASPSSKGGVGQRALKRLGEGLPMKQLGSRLAFLIVLAAALSQSVFGQATNGNISGTVMDPGEAVVQGCEVTLAHVTTGVTRSIKTDTSGVYRFNNVPVGLYSITARSEGFMANTLQSVTVSLNRTTTANLTLQRRGWPRDWRSRKLRP